MRLQRILDPHISSPRQGRLAALVLAAGACLVLPMASASPAAGDGPAAASPAPELANPVPGARLTSGYGDRWNPITKARGHHDGVDLGAREGTPVLSPGPGVVRVATESYDAAPHLGTVVIVDHGDGLATLYAHLASLAVSAGQRVDPGTTLGTVGATGDVTGPHLHLEVRDHGELVDPAGVLDLPAP